MSSPKTILITGSAGFIASNLVDRLLDGDPDLKIVGADNFNNYYNVETKIANISHHFDRAAIEKLIQSIDSPYRDFQAADDFNIHSGFQQASAEKLATDRYQLYGLDICDYKNLRKVFEENQITHIVNIAAVAGVRPSTEKPSLYQKNNGESVANLLSLAEEFGVKKFVHASSSSVYGSRSKVPFSEDEDVSKPISPYAASKVADEARLHSFHYLSSIPTIALRFFTVYGPRQRPDLAITKFTKLIDAGKTIQVYGDGSAKRDFTYIDDILDGIIKAIDLDCGFEIFNLGESQTTDVNTLIKMIEDALGKKATVEYTDPVPGDVPVTFADITKSQKTLGYKPQTKIDEGIKKFVAWLKDQ